MSLRICQRIKCIIALAVWLAAGAVCPSVRGVRAGAADDAPAPTGTMEDANRSFLKKYAEASERLKTGLSRLHARGRLLKSFAAKKKPAESTMLEFFALDGKRRVNIDYGAPQDGSGGTKPRPSEAMLLTLEAAAHVFDPGTEFALAKYLSEKPDGAFERKFDAKAWRYLAASYADLDCLARGSCVLDHVERDPETSDWLHARCHRSASARDTIDVWLDDEHDFVIRKVRVSWDAGMILVDLGPYMSIGNGGWLPEKYVLKAYGAKGSDSLAASVAAPPVEVVEFELIGSVETAGIPENCFTLDSLGVSFRRRPWRPWLLLALGAVLVAALVLSRWKPRVHQATPPQSSGARQELEGSQ